MAQVPDPILVVPFGRLNITYTVRLVPLDVAADRWRAEAFYESGQELVQVESVGRDGALAALRGELLSRLQRDKGAA